MKRRTLLKQLAVSTAAAFMLPSCLVDQKKVSLALTNLKVTDDEQKLISLIADTLIPQTDTPGAVALKADSFTLVMVDECMEKQEQQKFLAGMRGFDTAIKKITGNSFIDSDTETRTEILTRFEDSRDELSTVLGDETEAENVATFYNRTRRYVIQGYTSSEHYLTNVKKYVHIPGPDFKGCVPVSTNNATA